MTIMDKVKKLVIAPDSDEEYESEKQSSVETPEPRRETKKMAYPTPRMSTESVTSSNMTVAKPHTRAVVQINAPIKYEDAKKVLDHLLQGEVVVINLNHLEGEQRKRVYDFINGGVYAIRGHVGSVGENAYVLAPMDIEIPRVSKDILEGAVPGWN